MRTFVAISTPPDGPVPALLDDCRRRLDEGRPDVKWVAAPHRHITLRFLGEVDEHALEGIKGAVKAAAAGRAPFEARLTGWGAFPSAARPQTLWAAADAPEGALQWLERSLSNELRAIGIGPEAKPFHPHITLGRVRSQRGLDALVRGLKSPAPCLDGAVFGVDRLMLIESVLTPAGPKYTVLLEAPLGG